MKFKCISKFQPMIRGVKAGTLILLCLVATSCAQLDGTTTASEGQASEEQSTAPAGSEAVVYGEGEQANPEEPQAKTSELYLGDGKTFAMPSDDAVVSLEGDKVALNFENVPLVDVIHGVLGDILKQDYQIEGQITGQVTLRTQAPIERNELVHILEGMLQANGVTMVRREDGRYLVTSRKNFQSANPAFRSGKNLRPGYSNVIVPLDFIGAVQMAEILRPVADESAFVRVDAVRNILILGGMSGQLQGWLEIVETFDVNYLKGMSVGIIPIQNTSMDEILTALETLMANASEGGSPLAGLIRTAPLDSLGAVLVVTPRAELLKQVETWVERLDRSPEQGAEPQLYVYRVENGTAEHLAQLLSSIFGSGGGLSSSANKGLNSGVAPGLNSSSLSSSNNASSGGMSGSARGGKSGASSFTLGDTIRVVADDFNNSLLIHATAHEYKKIKSALEKLDVMPSQILIEASIIEVTLTDDLRFGLEWYFDNNLSGGWSGEGYVGLAPGPEVDLPAFGYAFTNGMGGVQALLSAESTKSLVKVLSTPSIMVLDNHAAKIHVGQQQPIRAGQTISDGGVISNSITYKDTGVKLDVIPSVNSGGLVTLELIQSVTDAGSPDPATGQRSFFERNIESRVAVRSGHTVVLGGLISDNATQGRTGLPFLSDLPLIGGLFGTTTETETRTELLVVITPHVMKTDQDIQSVTQEMRSRMKAFEIFEADETPIPALR